MSLLEEDVMVSPSPILSSTISPLHTQGEYFGRRRRSFTSRRSSSPSDFEIDTFGFKQKRVMKSSLAPLDE